MEAERHQTSAVIATLVDNHRCFLSFLMRRVGNPSDAEEILQAAFVKSVEKSHSIRDGETVVAWFYRVLRNAVIDYYRHRDAERRALERLDAMSSERETPEADSVRLWAAPGGRIVAFFRILTEPSLIPVSWHVTIRS